MLQRLKVPGGQLKAAAFSELDHMDTQVPTFIKGLRLVTAESFNKKIGRSLVEFIAASVSKFLIEMLSYWKEHIQ